MTQTAVAERASEQASDNTAIRPFHVNVPETELTELRRRINATNLPERETVTDASQGVQLATMQALARYWATEYDWRKIEAKLNALPQFITEIDGLDIHFIHVRSKHENALPLIVTHGWPGSITEQMKIIDPLTNPTAHGGNASDAFDVVIPSMPGYGFSGKPTTTGWDPAHIARAWTVLMKRLGYTKFVAQGGDWGAIITEQMGVQAPPELLGIHINMPGAVPAEIDKAAFTGAPMPDGLSPEEKLAFERLQFVYSKGVAYGYQMGLRPQTLYGIADSPVGLAAYFLDHDAWSYALISRVFQGESEGLTRDDILDNVTIAWLTNTGISGARLYWENKLGYFSVKGVSIPVAVSSFPDEIDLCPRSWAERAYPKLIHYNKLPKGGHFAAWEQPKLFSEEVRAGFRSLRRFFTDGPAVQEEIMKLAGKKALITGRQQRHRPGHSPPFHSSEGAEVAITGRDQQTLDDAVAELGSKAHGYRADVTVAEDRQKLFAELAKDFGKLDIVFANAGISGSTPTGTTDEAIFEKVVHTNLNGAFFTVNSAAPLHERQRQHHLQRIGAELSRSTRRGCLRCHERRTRLDGAIHRRRPCTAQDSRERGGPWSDENSHLEARATRQCHGRGIRKSFRLLLFHGSTCPLGRAGRSGQGCAFSCIGRFVVHQRDRADGGWRINGRSFRSCHTSRLTRSSPSKAGSGQERQT